MAAATSAAIAPAASAELSAEAPPKISQHPVGNLISVPFQYNANVGYGPERESLNVLNAQPVIPVDVNKDWNLITRTILPFIGQPPLSPGGDSASGFGDL